MVQVTIFVEGAADQKFIQDFVEFHFETKLKLKVDIKGFGGKDKWILNKADFEKSSSAGKNNILIFDADLNPISRREELVAKKAELGIEFDLFLFPNDRSSGELETLLLEITTEKSNAIFECFESYKNCINHLDVQYKKPDIKTKIFAYSEITSGKGNEKDRNYKDQNIWNLDNEYLNPLKLFLAKYFEDAV